MLLQQKGYVPFLAKGQRQTPQRQNNVNMNAVNFTYALCQWLCQPHTTFIKVLPNRILFEYSRNFRQAELIVLYVIVAYRPNRGIRFADPTTGEIFKKPLVYWQK